MAPQEAQVHQVVSPVYGPVDSWRFGRSLGIDPIGAVSTCSFNCVYCQLGEIQDVTMARRVYVPTERLIEDLKRVDWGKVDVVTFSGSGEPTLATNLGEMVAHLKDNYPPPVHLLTNATLFHLPEVRDAVRRIDVIACKLDAATEKTLQKMNRPAAGVTMESIVASIMALKADFPGKIALQVMFMPINRGELAALAELVKKIAPAEVQLNTPKRPYPLEWHVETRGDHARREFPWPTRRLTAIEPPEAREIEDFLRRETGLPIHSIYREVA